jgi:hypothetical protein
MKFRKKPVVIEAERFTVPDGEPGLDPGAMFMQYVIERDGDGYFLIIPTLGGDHRANNGDWIITGIAGEQYPCKPDIFDATYEVVEP